VLSVKLERIKDEKAQVVGGDLNYAQEQTAAKKEQLSWVRQDKAAHTKFIVRMNGAAAPARACAGRLVDARAGR
jgi:hypothetical protein